MAGAAISATCAYGINAMYQTVAFMRITGTTFGDLWPGKKDVEQLKALYSMLRR